MKISCFLNFVPVVALSVLLAPGSVYAKEITGRTAPDEKALAEIAAAKGNDFESLAKSITEYNQQIETVQRAGLKTPKYAKTERIQWKALDERILKAQKSAVIIDGVLNELSSFPLTRSEDLRLEKLRSGLRKSSLGWNMFEAVSAQYKHIEDDDSNRPHLQIHKFLHGKSKSLRGVDVIE